MKRLLVHGLLFLLFSFGSLKAQETQEEQALEEMAATMEAEEMEENDLLEQLDHLRRHPILLNKATAEELSAIPFLSDWHINQFLHYRNRFGSLLSFYELQAVPGWDTDLLLKLKSFVHVRENEAVPLRRRWAGGEYSMGAGLLLGYPLASGFSKEDSLGASYAGSAWKWRMHFRYQYARLLQWGITLEKDAGEKLLRNGMLNGFASFHLMIRDWKGCSQINIGDFTVNMGQGLLQWQGMGIGAGGNATGIYRQSPLLRPHTSAGEFQFYRGAAVSIEGKKGSGMVYAGARKLSASLDFSDSGAAVASALNTAGLYRTKTEWERKNNTNLWVAGGAYQYRRKRISLGFNGAYTHLAHALKPSEAPYQLYYISGRSSMGFSGTLSYTGKSAYVFSEVAFDKNLHPAFLAGCMMVPHPKLELAFLARGYAREYAAWNGNSFGHNTKTGNEMGFYSGMKWVPSRKITVDAWIDGWKHPWLKYRVSAPVSGKAVLLQVRGTPNKKTEWRILLKQLWKCQDASPENNVWNQPEEVASFRLQGFVSWIPSTGFQYRSRVEYVVQRKEFSLKESGSLWYSDFRWNLFSGKWVFDARILYFQTGSYNTRIYAAERNMLFQSGVPAFYGNGWRLYGIVHWKRKKRLHGWIKIGHSAKPGVEEIGSGNDATAGSGRTDLSMQWEILF